jgi:hypothetical protein
MTSTDAASHPPHPADSDGARQLLRHTLATLAYRGGKAVGGAPDGFGGFRVAEGSRTPVQILAHVGDLLEWALWLAQGSHRWRDATPGLWDAEVERFFAGLERLDGYLASDAPLGWSAERLFQGPIADALTHVGQITMLRRLAGAPVRGENYAKADIAAGRVGPQQAPSAVEFD